MKERKIIAKPLGIQVGVQTSVEMTKEPDFTVDAETGRVEWSSGLTSSEIAALKIALNVQNPNLIAWNSFKRHIDANIPLNKIAAMYKPAKGQKSIKGYSRPQIGRFSRAYRKLKADKK